MNLARLVSLDLLSSLLVCLGGRLVVSVVSLSGLSGLLVAQTVVGKLAEQEKTAMRM
jgi:hypothetical protein